MKVVHLMLVLESTKVEIKKWIIFKWHKWIRNLMVEVLIIKLTQRSWIQSTTKTMKKLKTLKFKKMDKIRLMVKMMTKAQSVIPMMRKIQNQTHLLRPWVTMKTMKSREGIVRLQGSKLVCFSLETSNLDGMSYSLVVTGIEQSTIGNCK